MTTYTVQGPSGKSYTIDGPEGATADQLGQVILANSHDERVAAETAKMRAEYDPTSGMSPLERFAVGVPRGAASVVRGVGQLIGQVLPDENSTAGQVSRLLISNLPGGHLVTSIPNYTQEQVDQAKREDAPLRNTTAGNAGYITGQAAVVAPTALAVPPLAAAMPALGAAAPYVAAGLVGGTTGAVTTEGGLKERAIGAAGGGAGGVVGTAIGKGLGLAATAIKDRVANALAAAAPRQAAVQAAQDAGYVLPPREINPDLKNALTQSWAGPVKTTQAAAAANQANTNALAAKALGLPPDQPITVDALNGVRQAAGQAYDAVAQSGVIKPTPAYEAALDKIVAPFKQAAAGFPNAKPNPIIDTIDSLRSPEFDASSAIAKVQELRNAADVAFRAGDKAAGKALKGGAGAIEDAIDQHLQSTGAPSDVLQAFRDARTTIAKTYDVQKALRGDNVSAQALAAAQQRSPGRLTNELADIATAGANFPKSTALLKEAPSPYSAVDAGFGAAELARPGVLATIAARPLIRAAILSQPGQKFAAMQPGPTIQNALALGLGSDAAKKAALLGGMSSSNLLLSPVGQQ